MTEFRGLQIYASCAIAIYLYELIVCSLSKDIKWYKTKLWSVPEIVCFFLEKFMTIIYCIITLMFLYYTSHTQLSCTILLLVQQGFFAVSTAFHCFILLLRFRMFYPKRPYLAISLFLFAAMTVLFLMINVLGFGAIDVNKLDKNCYLTSALEGNNESDQLSGLFSVGFIMLMIYCWIIWAFVCYSIYTSRNTNFSSKKRYWRRMLFDDGFMYLSLIAFSQAVNVIFIFDGKNYLRKYINTTPLLILTSICTQRLLINVRLFVNNNIVINNGVGDSFRSFSFIDEKGINNNKLQEYQHQQSPGMFIDQFYLQGQGQPQQQRQQNQQQEQNYPQKLNIQTNDQQNYNQSEFAIRIPSPTYSSFTSSTKVNSIPPSLPPIIVHRNTTSDIDEEEEEVRYSYIEYDDKALLSSLDKKDKRRTTQDFGSALLEYFNSLTLSSPVTPTNPINRSSRNNLAPRNSEQYNNNNILNNTRISKISRLSNLNMNGFNNKERLSQGIRNSQQPSQPILVDPNDIYYFTYSDDNDVYLFPAIPIQSAQEEENMNNNYIRKSNESLTPPAIRHQSFAFTGKITTDNSDNNLVENKKIVRASDIENILSKEKSNNKQYGFI
ncbi:hypothetical protein RclHR1_00760030 [Rhizophagus clarus]|nr:hypothetical protein RclHR1_00760030 [Rhizophagus clarus]